MSELSVHSFIIKLWFEQASEEDADSIIWRGYITHVPGGERASLKDLGGVTAFIAPYLETDGVRVGMRKRLTHWFRRLRRDTRRK